MRLRTRELLWGLAMIALAALPVRGDEPVNRSIKMPACDSYRKPYDSWDNEQTEDSGFQRRVKIAVSPAKFPYPLLKYRFNVYATELEPGNAAPLYSRAARYYRRL